MKFKLIGLALAIGVLSVVFLWWPYPLYATYTITVDNIPAKTQQVIVGAKTQLGKTLFYDASYVRLDYPNGDVPIIKGVCTDVVIRAFRTVGFDLQKEVHEDMKKYFSAYPNHWGLTSTDKNIDHRRVPNLQIFFKRKGWSVPKTQSSQDYQPGDIVSWKFDNGLDHIGLVTDKMTTNQVPLVIHNAGMGAQMEDVLFTWKITGHYRPQW